MRRWILIAKRSIPRPREKVGAANDHGADRHLSRGAGRARFVEREGHPPQILLASDELTRHAARLRPDRLARRLIREL
jgi:hypothetical protein